MDALYAKYPVRGVDPEEMSKYDIRRDPVQVEIAWRKQARFKPEDGVLYLTGTSVPIEEVRAIYVLLFG